MSEAGTCLLLEGEKVREALTGAHRASLLGAATAGPEAVDKAWTMNTMGDPAALVLGCSGAMAAIESLYRHLFGEELKGALSDGD